MSGKKILIQKMVSIFVLAAAILTASLLSQSGALPAAAPAAYNAAVSSVSSAGPEKKNFIKYVEFNVTYLALKKAMNLDIESHQKGGSLNWIDILAYLGAKYGGDFNHYKSSDMENRLDKKTIVENDANAAAFGEYRAGALRGAKIAIAITLGTGVGSGIIIDGKILAGSNYAGGEMGHTVIVVNGRQCTCGRKGCWEMYASASGLIQTTREAMEKDRSSAMWNLAHGDLKNVDGRTAFQAMREGDAAGKAVVDEYIEYLASGLTNCINVFQPDILCIGGGVSNEGDPLMVPLKKLVMEQVYSINSEKQTVICRAQLGNDAGILGAALLGV